MPLKREETERKVSAELKAKKREKGPHKNTEIYEYQEKKVFYLGEGWDSQHKP